MLKTILLAICAIGEVMLCVLLFIHMVHMKKAFDQVKVIVQQLTKK